MNVKEIRAFSPNDDNVNDDFVTLASCPFEQYELMIFNRWGERVFKSNNPFNTWRGDRNGVQCPAGVYCYLLKYKYPNQAGEIRKGDIVLLR